MNQLHHMGERHILGNRHSDIKFILLILCIFFANQILKSQCVNAYQTPVNAVHLNGSLEILVHNVRLGINSSGVVVQSLKDEREIDLSHIILAYIQCV
jgi:hypothetical protein